MKMLDLAPVGYHTISSKAHRFHIDHFFLRYCPQFDGQSAEAVECQQTSLPALLQGSHQREELCGPGLKRRLRCLWWAVTSKKTLLSNCLCCITPSVGETITCLHSINTCVCVCVCTGSENNSLYLYYKGLSKTLLTFKFDTVKSVLDKDKKEDDTNEFVSAVCWRALPDGVSSPLYSVTLSLTALWRVHYKAILMG